MTKDEMKNRISMALKDPTLQQGFEIICKENSELEKRNEQLTNAKELLKWFVWYFREGNSNLVPYKHKVKEAEQFLNCTSKDEKKTFEEWKADNSHEIEDLADYFMRHDTEDYFVHDKYLEAYKKIELLCKAAFDRE